jgi:hypothetical protein
MGSVKCRAGSEFLCFLEFHERSWMKFCFELIHSVVCLTTGL